MVAVAVPTSLGAAVGPLEGVLGFLFELVSFRWAAAHIAAGCLACLLVVLAGTAWRRRGAAEEVRTARAAPIAVCAIWAALTTFDEHARDGVTRAIPLAILCTRSGERGPGRVLDLLRRVPRAAHAGHGLKSQAAVRVGSAIFGVLLLAAM
jgi:hypothetical protein